MIANGSELYPVKKEDFLAWCEGKVQDAIIGRRGNPCMCPMAIFLATKGFSARVYLDTTLIMNNNKRAAYKNPDWVQQVVEFSDMQVNSLVTVADVMPAFK